MSPEKKPRKVVAKKGVTKKSVEMPVVEMTAAAVVPAVTAKTSSKTAVKVQTKSKAKSLQVSIDDVIRLRAYEIYLQRGATPGNPREDWDVAEREVRAHFGQEADA